MRMRKRADRPMDRLELWLRGDFRLQARGRDRDRDRAHREPFPFPTQWSLYLGLIALVGTVTILILPASRPLGEVIGSGSAWTPAPFFAGVLVLSFGIFALNIGQGEEQWGGRFGDRLRPYLVHLILQLLLGLLLTAPSFLIFHLIAHATPLGLISGGAYLLYYGLALGSWGLFLGTLTSESLQFQLKYLGFIGYLGGTFFWPPLSPLSTLQLLLELEGEAHPLPLTLTLEALSGLVLLSILGGGGLLLARRRLKLWLWKGSSSS